MRRPSTLTADLSVGRADASRLIEAGAGIASRAMPCIPPPETIRTKSLRVAVRRRRRDRRRARPSARLSPHRRRDRLRRLRLLRPPLRARGRAGRPAEPPAHERRPARFLYRALDPDEAQRLAARHLAAHDDGELYLQYRADRSVRLRRRAAEDRRLSHAIRASACAACRARRPPSPMPTKSAPRRSTAPRRRCKLLDPAKGTAAAAAAAHQPRDVRRRRSAVARSRSRARSRCARKSTPPRAPAIRAWRRSASCCREWSVVEIVRADGFVATDVRPLVRLNVSIVAKQGDRRETGSFGLGGRYLYDRLFEPATWNRAIDEALAQALVNLRIGRRAGRRNAGRARPRLVRRAAPRSGRPRARRRFQPQGHLGLFRAHRANASPRPA